MFLRMVGEYGPCRIFCVSKYFESNTTSDWIKHTISKLPNLREKDQEMFMEKRKKVSEHGSWTCVLKSAIGGQVQFQLTGPGFYLFATMFSKAYFDLGFIWSECKARSTCTLQRSTSKETPASVI